MRRAKHVVMLDALENGHTFTSADGITIKGLKDNAGVLYVVIEDEENETPMSLTINGFIMLCDSIPDAKIDELEAELEGLRPRS